MKYIDIMSGAISHFTNIPEEKVIERFRNMQKSDKDSRKLLKSLMEVEFPRMEGQILLNYLKEKKLSNTITFLMNSIDIYKNEIHRQSIVN